MLNEQQLTELRHAPPDSRNRLSKAMELCELTQVQVAEKTGHTQSYVSRVCAGRYSDLPGETMRAFSNLFGCAIEDLFPAREQSVAS